MGDDLITSNGLTELVNRVHGHGAQLSAERGQLKLRGEIPEALKTEIREHREDLKELLAWDQEHAMGLWREALRYVAVRYVPAAENRRDGELQWAVDKSFEAGDMWAFRIARREWVTSWLKAMSEHRKENKAA